MDFMLTNVKSPCGRPVRLKDVNKQRKKETTAIYRERKNQT